MNPNLNRTSFAALAAAALLGACSLFGGGGDRPDFSPGPNVRDGNDPGYIVGPEDVLEISVWKEDSLKKEVLVRPDGGLSFPLAGDLYAAGRTTAEIKAVITKRLEKYIPDPVVSITVIRVASNKIYVLGRVNKPGEYSAGRYVDVLQALSMAGGLTPFASPDRIKILRREGGKDIAIPFEYSAVEKGRALEQNIFLRGGDTVIVP